MSCAASRTPPSTRATTKTGPLARVLSSSRSHRCVRWSPPPFVLTLPDQFSSLYPPQSHTNFDPARLEILENSVRGANRRERLSADTLAFWLALCARLRRAIGGLGLTEDELGMWVDAASALSPFDPSDPEEMLARIAMAAPYESPSPDLPAPGERASRGSVPRPSEEPSRASRSAASRQPTADRGTSRAAAARKVAAARESSVEVDDDDDDDFTFEEDVRSEEHTSELSHSGESRMPSSA